MICWVLETSQAGKASHRYKVTLSGEGPVNRQEPNLLPWGCVGTHCFPSMCSHRSLLPDPALIAQLWGWTSIAHGRHPIPGQSLILTPGCSRHLDPEVKEELSASHRGHANWQALTALQRGGGKCEQDRKSHFQVHSQCHTT